MPGGEVSKPGEHHDVELEAAGVVVLLHNWSHSTEPTQYTCRLSSIHYNIWIISGYIEANCKTCGK